MTQKLSEKYKELATALGDVEFKLQLLKQEKSRLVASIADLNKLAGEIKAWSDETDKVSSTQA